MKESDLIKLFPRLWHMAEHDSWDSIRQHGLLSTSALLDQLGIKGQQRIALESQRRPDSVVVSGRNGEHATIRDNMPMREAALIKCLQDDLTPQAWFELLNQRAFFWLSKKRLRKLLGAKAYRERRQTVLTVDTGKLVEAHRDRIELSPINSGSTIYKPQLRGKDTFRSIDDYPYDERRKTRSAEASIAELVVVGGVSDIMPSLIAAHTVYKGRAKELWRLDGTLLDDGP